MFKPTIFQLPASKIELVNEAKISSSYSQINAQPLFKYGFHHYINQSKDKLVLLNNDILKGKTFYNIIENFDNEISNYEECINKVSKKYIGDTFSRDKLELLEILTIFGLEGNLYVNDENFDELIKVFYKTSKLKYKAIDDYKKTDIYININSPVVDIKQEEQNQIINFLESICEISEGLNKNGGCIIKLYDTYTEVSIKLLKLIN